MKHFVIKYPAWVICFLTIGGAILYWSWLATDRYLSQANVVIATTQPLNTGSGGGLTASLEAGGSYDLLVLRDYLLSVDMLKILDNQLGLRAHYANPQIDWISRMSAVNLPTEDFYKYFLTRVTVDFDDYAQILRISAEAYDPKVAQAIVTRMLTVGEAHINNISHRLAEEQVKFMEKQVDDLRGRLISAGKTLIAYQNKHGLVSPQGTVESLSSVVSGLEQELAQAKANRLALSASQSERSADMMRAKNQIDALNKQIEHERARLAVQSGESLNQVAAEYQLLQLQVDYIRQLYTSGIAALENTRAESVRLLKQVSVLQAPTYPEYSTRPARLYNITAFTMLTLLVGLFTQLLIEIIRDHKD